MHYFLPAITASTHVISPRDELYTGQPVDGVIMRDWLAGASRPRIQWSTRVEEGTLVTDYPGVNAFPCDIN